MFLPDWYVACGFSVLLGRMGIRLSSWHIISRDFVAYRGGFSILGDRWNGGVALKSPKAIIFCSSPCCTLSSSEKVLCARRILSLYSGDLMGKWVDTSVRFSFGISIHTVFGDSVWYHVCCVRDSWMYSAWVPMSWVDPSSFFHPLRCAARKFGMSGGGFSGSALVSIIAIMSGFSLFMSSHRAVLGCRCVSIAPSMFRENILRVGFSFGIGVVWWFSLVGGTMYCDRRSWLNLLLNSSCFHRDIWIFPSVSVCCDCFRVVSFFLSMSLAVWGFSVMYFVLDFWDLCCVGGGVSGFVESVKISVGSSLSEGCSFSSAMCDAL